MKLIVVFAATVALCAGSVIPGNDEIPGIPGDNSHYVEGESRYIWMPDGEGVPQLVDLHEPVDPVIARNRNQGSHNAYWLYTRNNPNNPQIIVYGNANTIHASNYHGGRPLKMIIHGWNNNGHSTVNTLIRENLLAVGDYNVIVVDWSQLAASNYNTAAWGVPNVGEFAGEFIGWLYNNAGGNWQQTHLIGHSLGAHAAGNAGRKAFSWPARITGLDPAGPTWGNNGNALRASDGGYVECIHTDGGLLGINDPIGRTDFYPNGGRNPQPGCWISTCSHGRATELFAATVRYNHLLGRQCSNLAQANGNQCTGGQLHMGNAWFPKSGNGMFSLSTGQNWPF